VNKGRSKIQRILTHHEIMATVLQAYKQSPTHTSKPRAVQDLKLEIECFAVPLTTIQNVCKCCTTSSTTRYCWWWAFRTFLTLNVKISQVSLYLYLKYEHSEYVFLFWDTVSLQELLTINTSNAINYRISSVEKTSCTFKVKPLIFLKPKLV